MRHEIPALGLTLGMMMLAPTAPGQVLSDTIGFTTRDRQVYGPALRYIVNDTLSGVHAVWKDGLGTIRYNFRPRHGAWHWPGGTPLSPYPRNLGALDVNVTNGRALISTDYLAQGASRISVFTDTAAGAGTFEEQEIAEGYRNSIVGTANYGYTKYAAVRRDTLYFTSFLSRSRIDLVGPFPAFNLAVSKQSGRYGCIWTPSEGPNSGTLYLKLTPNNGGQWYKTDTLSDLVPSPLNRSLLAACATYDTIRIHLVADLYDGVDPHRSQIWHYCPYDTPAWRLIQDYSCPEAANLGDLALAADRPSIGIDRRRQEYYTIWEQFDPSNVDPLTGLCRADVWGARSLDTGHTWGEPVRLTVPDNTSKRFPFLAEVVDDTLHILYFADSVAGFWEQGQGPQTSNPVVYLRVAADFLPAAVNEPRAGPERAKVTVSPTVSTSDFTVDVGRGRPINRLEVLDCAGRAILKPAPACGQVHLGSSLPPGIYFIRVDSDAGTSTHRVVKAR